MEFDGWTRPGTDGWHVPPAGDARLAPRGLPTRSGSRPPAGRPELVDGVARWEGVCVQGTPPEVAELGSLAFFDCDVDGLSLAGLRLSLRLVDCNLASLDLANTHFDSLEVASCTLTGSRLVGARLAGALRDVVVSDCQLDLASLRMSTLIRSELRACSLRETDLFSATLDSVLLTGCDLTGADVSRATCTRSAIEGCELDGLRGIEALSGVRIPLADLLPIVPLLADALGIIPAGAGES